ncbi:hypothetical protein RvY_10399 [Ramazzottius varieornatus]|uniref:Purple acid phosphatase n=1 Tax=Ramazzottius varieornatus TaxID=947166 RepID=A0A1D1VKD8_RAMVA|nr:hypothetical protein RvY_10399 [Ramazzottius varieornatus]
MRVNWRWSVCSVVLLCVPYSSAILLKTNPEENAPEQIHLSWSGNPTEMYVTWATPRASAVSSVRFGMDNKTLTSNISGESTTFVDGAVAHKVRYIHRATMQYLQPGNRYYYQVGSDAGWSDVYSFRSIRNGSDWSPRLLVYGDMGAVNARSLQQMTKEVLEDRYDLVLHVGDFAYDLPTRNGDVGDEFLRNLEPLAANIPYMTVVGNHEEKFNFSHYKNRFTCPGDSEGMFYSIDVGPLHITVISTEFYFFLRYGVQQIYNQFYWLGNDLQKAAAKDSNAWIFVAGHRPLYCSNPDIVDCNPKGNIFRKGIPLLMIPGIEDLLYESGVDVGIWAHEHSYERTWPVYDLKVLNGSASEPYTDPEGIVHIITGSAGCQENHTRFNPHPYDFSAFHTTDYGFTRMTVHNRTHLQFEQVSDDKNYVVVDSVWVKKTSPGRPVWYREKKRKQLLEEMERIRNYDRFNGPLVRSRARYGHPRKPAQQDPKKPQRL